MLHSAENFKTYSKKLRCFINDLNRGSSGKRSNIHITDSSPSDDKSAIIHYTPRTYDRKSTSTAEISDTNQNQNVQDKKGAILTILAPDQVNNYKAPPTSSI